MTRLMISVRDAAEAKTALAGGAQMIDVKEPSRGALGAADQETIRRVVNQVQGKCPISVALGELSEGPIQLAGNLPIDYAKIGLAGMRKRRDWFEEWRRAVACIPNTTRAVAVAYPDASHAPPVWEIVRLARQCGCRALLIDTFHKNGQNLFDSLSPVAIDVLLRTAGQQGLPVVLAGSLNEHVFERALSLRPYAVAVRGAACVDRRDGTVDLKAVCGLAEQTAKSTPQIG